MSKSGVDRLPMSTTHGPKKCSPSSRCQYRMSTTNDTAYNRKEMNTMGTKSYISTVPSKTPFYGAPSKKSNLLDNRLKDSPKTMETSIAYQMKQIKSRGAIPPVLPTVAPLYGVPSKKASLFDDLLTDEEEELQMTLPQPKSYWETSFALIGSQQTKEGGA